jgi:tetratricopeptide (TPR) repeat protein
MSVGYGSEVTHPNCLREWIALRHYKVSGLADRTGIPLRTLWNYIAGRTAIEPVRLRELANVLQCRPEQLTWEYTFSAGSEQDMKRRELLRLLGVASAALLLPLPDVDWERIDDVVELPGRLDLPVIQDLETINTRYWNLYLTASSKSTVLDGALGQLKVLVRFLKEPHRAAVRPRLCALASNLGQMVGEIFFDQHEFLVAQSCYVFAAFAAKEAQDYDLWTTALVRHAYLPLYEDRYEEALPFLKEAMRLANRGNASLPTRYWAAGVEAEAEAGVHDLAACQRALDRAQGVQGIKEPGPAWTRFDASRLPALQGACYVRLEQPGLALPTLQSAIGQFTKPSRRRGMVLTDLATAVQQQGEIEQACTYLQGVMDIVSLGASEFLREGVVKTRQRLEPFARSSAVMTLDKRMRSLAVH